MRVARRRWPLAFSLRSTPRRQAKDNAYAPVLVLMLLTSRLQL